MQATRVIVHINASMTGKKEKTIGNNLREKSLLGEEKLLGTQTLSG